MATWVRQGTGTAPSNTDSNLVGQYALDNATAPVDFDPAAVNSVRCEWTITGSGFNDDSWTNDSCAVVGGVSSTEISQHPSAGGANLQNVSEASDHTDSTGIPTGLTTADWEAAFVRGDGVDVPNEWVNWNKVMGPDGSTLTVSALTVTIDYTASGGTPQSISVASASESETAQAVTSSNTVSVSVGAVTETDTAQAITASQPGGSGEITLVGTPQANGAGNGDSLTLTFDVAPQEDDVVVVSIAQGDASLSGTDDPTPAGYTKLTPVEYMKANEILGLVAYKVMGATPDTDVTIPGSGAAQDSVVATSYVLRGVDTSNVEDVAEAFLNAGTGSDPDHPSITTATDNAWVIVMGFMGRDIAPSAAPSGYSGLATFTQVDTARSAIGTAYKEVATAGTEDPGTWTWSDSTNEKGLFTVAIRPATGGAGGQSVSVGAITETEAAQTVSTQASQSITVTAPAEASLWSDEFSGTGALSGYTQYGSLTNPFERLNDVAHHDGVGEGGMQATVDDITNQADLEIYFEFQYLTEIARRWGVSARNNGVQTADPAGYAVAVDNSGVHGWGQNRLEIAEMDGTTRADHVDTDGVLATVAKTFVDTTWYSVRFRLEGTALKARVWERGTAEPGAWDLETTHSTHTSGTAGLHTSNSNNRPTEFDFLVIDALAGGGEAEAGQPIAVTTSISVSVGAASESEAAEVVSPSQVAGPQTQPVVTVSEAEASQAITTDTTTSVAVGAASEAEVGQPVTSQTSISVAITSALENETAQAITVQITISVSVGAVTETEAAQAITADQATIVVVNAANESEAAQTISSVAGAVTVAITSASELEAVNPVLVNVDGNITPAIESETGQPITATTAITAAVDEALETESGQLVGIGLGLGAVSETEAARTVGASQAGAPQTRSVTAVTETDTAELVSIQSTVTALAVATTESEAGQPVTTVLTVVVGAVTEAEAVQAIDVLTGGAPQSISVTATTETETAEPITTDLTISILVGAVTETDSAQIISLALGVGSALETEESRLVAPVQVGAPQTRPVESITETETAQVVDGFTAQVASVSPASESEAPEVITPVSLTSVSVDPVSEIEEVTAITVLAGATSIAVAFAAESDQANPVSVAAVFLAAIGVALETEQGAAITMLQGAASVPVTAATETELSQTIVVDDGIVGVVGGLRDPILDGRDPDLTTRTPVLTSRSITEL